MDINTFTLVMIIALLYVWGGITSLALAYEYQKQSNGERVISWFSVLFWFIPVPLIHLTKPVKVKKV